MHRDTILLVAEDDDGQFSLLKKNFERCGIWNEMIRFRDGQEVIDFLLGKSGDARRRERKPYLLLVDVRLPKIDGVEVLKRIKQDEQVKKLPVVVLSKADDARQIERCHSLGCSMYIVKPVEYKSFVDMVHKIGLFLSAVEVPLLDGVLQKGQIDEA